jgi:hypothetical protein
MRKKANKTHLNHPKIPFDIIVLEQVNFLPLDPIQLLPMDSLFPLVELFYISIEALKTLSFSLETILQFLSASYKGKALPHDMGRMLVSVNTGIQHLRNSIQNNYFQKKVRLG